MARACLPACLVLPSEAALLVFPSIMRNLGNAVLGVQDMPYIPPSGRGEAWAVFGWAWAGASRGRWAEQAKRPPTMARASPAARTVPPLHHGLRAEGVGVRVRRYDAGPALVLRRRHQ